MLRRLVRAGSGSRSRSRSYGRIGLSLAWRGGSTRGLAASSVLGRLNPTGPDDDDDGGRQGITNTSSSRSRPTRRRRLRHQSWLLGGGGADAQQRGFRLNPKYEMDRAHKHVGFGDLARLILTERLTFGGAVAAIGLASASSLVIPHIFGSVVDILSAAATVAPPDLAQAAASASMPPPPVLPPDAAAAVAAAGAEEGGGGIASTLGSIRDPTVLEALKDNAWKMLGVSVVGTGATYVSTAQLDIVGQRISMDLRKRLFGRILDQDLAFFDVNKTGELANRLSTDVHEVAEHLVENLSKFLFSGVMAVGSAGMLVYISPTLSAITLSVVPAVLLGATGYAKVVKRLSRELLNALASSTQHAAERMGAIRIVRHFAAEEREKARYAQIIDDSMGLAKRLAVSEGAYVSVIYLISNFALLGVLFMGAGMVVDGQLTVGALASYCLYATNLSEAMKDATDGVAGMIKAQGAAGRLYALLEVSPTLTKGSLVLPRESIRGEITFKDVDFAYPTRSSTPVMQGLNLTIHPGQNLGVTGPSGCGKSSLALLLCRMYAPTSGRVLLDGHDIAALDPTFLRTTVGVITQEPLLFSGTVRENIAYGKPDATEAEIEEAARLANAHDFIAKLPQQYDTQIGERALALSGGQKQRLSIARCMLTQPKVLVLDEATSALDAANQAAVLHKLLAKCKVHTVVMIGHSPRQLEGCTRLVTLDKHGRVVRDEAVFPRQLPTIVSEHYADGSEGDGGEGNEGKGKGKEQQHLSDWREWADDEEAGKRQAQQEEEQKGEGDRNGKGGVGNWNVPM